MNATLDQVSSTFIKPILDEYYIQGMTETDLRLVAAIERTSKETFWDYQDFYNVLYDSGVQGRIITYKSSIVGHYLFQLVDNSIQLLNLTIAPDCRRQRLGSTIIETLIRDYVEDARSSLTCYVRDSNISAHLFLRSNHFKAKGVERAYFVDYDVANRPHHEDAYYFVYET